MQPEQSVSVMEGSLCFLHSPVCRLLKYCLADIQEDCKASHFGPILWPFRIADFNLWLSNQMQHSSQLDRPVQVKKLKDSENALGVTARPKRPRALVLGPTRELTDQILGVAKMLSHHAKFRSACINGGESRASSQATLCMHLAEQSGPCACKYCTGIILDFWNSMEDYADVSIAAQEMAKR